MTRWRRTTRWAWWCWRVRPGSVPARGLRCVRAERAGLSLNTLLVCGPVAPAVRRPPRRPDRPAAVDRPGGGGPAGGLGERHPASSSSATGAPMRDANGDELGRPVAVGVRPTPTPPAGATALAGGAADGAGRVAGGDPAAGRGGPAAGRPDLAQRRPLRGGRCWCWPARWWCCARAACRCSSSSWRCRRCWWAAAAWASACCATCPSGPARCCWRWWRWAWRCAIARAWLRVLLGALMAGLVGFALLGPRWFLFGRHGLDDGLAGVPWAAAAVAGRAGRARPLPRTRLAALIESLAAGWLLVTLAGLAWLAGMTFLVGGSLGGGVARRGRARARCRRRDREAWARGMHAGPERAAGGAGRGLDRPRLAGAAAGGLGAGGGGGGGPGVAAADPGRRVAGLRGHARHPPLAAGVGRCAWRRSGWWAASTTSWPGRWRTRRCCWWRPARCWGRWRGG